LQKVYNHSEKVVDVAEAVGSAKDEFDLVVDSFGTSIGEVEHGGSKGSRKEAFDFLAQLPEDRNPAPLGPSHPLERKKQEAVPAIKKRFGKNAIMKGTSLEEWATTINCNNLIGGHRA